MSKTDMKTREISPSFRGSLLEKVDLGVDKAPLSEEDAGATKKTLQDSAWADVRLSRSPYFPSRPRHVHILFALM